jgi:DNA-binding HxlR family transcriptional regulator
METGDTRLCPQVEAAFALLAKKWAGLIVFTLDGGAKHFVELKESLPALSARVLTLRVRDLEGLGLIERRVSASSPVRTSYALTTKGQSFALIMRKIAEWAKSD